MKTKPNKNCYNWLCDAILSVKYMREVGLDTSIGSLKESLPAPPFPDAWWKLEKLLTAGL